MDNKWGYNSDTFEWSDLYSNCPEITYCLRNALYKEQKLL